MTKATGADLVMLNPKGIRAGLPQGEVKVSDIFNVMPFDNALVTVDITGEEVVKLLDESARRGDQTSLLLSDGKFSLATDTLTQKSQLVFNARCGDVPDGFIPMPENDELRDPLNAPCVVPEQARLKVATIDFLLEGGLGYFEAGQTPVTAEHGGLREALQVELQSRFPDE